MRGDIGHVQRRKARNRRRAVVVGRPAHQAEPGQGHQRIHLALHVGVNRRATIKAPGKGRQDGDPLRLEGADDGVIMRGVRRQDIGPQHQKAHRRRSPLRARQIARIGRHPGLEAWVIKPDLGVIHRSGSLYSLPGRVGRIAADQKADHRLQIVVRPAQPVLHRQEPGPHVLRLAGNPAQDLRQPAQQGHLLLPGRGRRRRPAAQLLQKGHRARRGLRHVQIAHPGQLDDLRVGDHAHHRVQLRAHLGQGRHDRRQMFLDEQQVRDDDIRLGHSSAGAGERRWVLGPFGSSVDRNLDARKDLRQPWRDAGGRASGMGIQRQDHEAIARLAPLRGQRRLFGLHMAVIAHNGPLPRKASRC
jgi:hypothetical protein